MQQNTMYNPCSMYINLNKEQVVKRDANAPIARLGPVVLVVVAAAAGVVAGVRIVALI